MAATPTTTANAAVASIVSTPFAFCALFALIWDWPLVVPFVLTVELWAVEFDHEVLLELDAATIAAVDDGEEEEDEIVALEAEWDSPACAATSAASARKMRAKRVVKGIDARMVLACWYQGICVL
ncbi:hypothetical protein SAICODRAFT_177945 [Saitoella complicata NRRL Y-17804]|uniref:uncharacterized protein n=1 Tax=Saitoella complicata (strain BCRC 22490 / CBS 7301 / JCM 7358 / NBRC 10748 / NRRL Y-17804) TaxID=698492 RepID=UPI00086795BE|nr:uncharacterized protein SAICODRAFT_177945 [Saitoella complicata NRRL Y-17804]ODQ50156.1 hypothetical protein SAICODRAFT_177945 [Saitoella complicata NRRL Y-17804]